MYEPAGIGTLPGSWRICRQLLFLLAACMRTCACSLLQLLGVGVDELVKRGRLDKCKQVRILCSELQSLLKCLVLRKQ